ncbi:MAG TPA: YHS domain-containing protein, partial [Hyphomicrobiaceae bacterium]|nr:YHS domain-containing protein [Hyphomicrobiaceae bacterium]
MSAKLGGGQHAPQHHHVGPRPGQPVAAPARAPVKDPVCGMSVDPQNARHSFEHAGQTWYFCSARCRERFAE